MQNVAPNSVTICGIEMLHWFGQSLQIMDQKYAVIIWPGLKSTLEMGYLHALLSNKITKSIY